MNTADLYQLLLAKNERLQESFEQLNEQNLSEKSLSELQQSLKDVSDALVVLKFMTGIPEESSFSVERELTTDVATPSSSIEESESHADIMHEIDEFENAIAEDAALAEDSVEQNSDEELLKPEMDSVSQVESEKTPQEESEVKADSIAKETLEPEGEETNQLNNQEFSEVPDVKQSNAKLQESAKEETQESVTVDTNSKLAQIDNSLAGRLKKSPVSDLKGAIGLNQRFLFSNELFNGNMEAFNRAINELNHLATIDDAKRFIEIQLIPTYEWSTDSETVLEFVELVERRFM